MPKLGAPSACQARSVSMRSCANSAGSSENAASTPPSARDSVKCFSMTHAPNATAATAAPQPIVWSDRPTSQPKASRSTGMLRRLVFSGVDG